MKQVWSLLLLLCLLSALVPTAAMAKEAAEPAELTELYVQEGLVAIFDAVDPDNGTVDLASGTWKSMDGTYTATLRGGNAWWQKGERGIGYAMTQDQWTAGAATVGLALPVTLLSEEAFTAEAVLLPKGTTNEDGTRYIAPESAGMIYGNYNANLSAFDFGALRCLQFGGHYQAVPYVTRWFYDPRPWQSHQGDGVALGDSKNLAGDGLAKTLAVTYSCNPAQDVEIKVLVNCTQTTYFNNREPGRYKDRYYPVGQNGFNLLAGFPGEVYTVRVYSRALSEAELAHNAFVDLARYYGFPLAEYLTYTAEEKAYVEKTVVAYGFGSDAATVAAAIPAARAAYHEEQARLEQERLEYEKLLSNFENWPEYEKYYVKDGLAIFLDAFVTMPELNDSVDLEAGVWRDAKTGAVATIHGKEYWQRGKNGQGIGYQLTLQEYLKGYSGNIYLSLDPAAYLTPSFTVETVSDMKGVTDESGKRVVDIPPEGTRAWGVYSDRVSTFAFGSFRAMSFVCDSKATRGTPMEHRWLYTPKEWAEHQGGAGYRSDSAISKTGGRVISYAMIRNQSNSEKVTFTTRLDLALTTEHSTAPVSDSFSQFHLFRGFPATVYAIRVYDRPLSPSELSQNHMADLIAYYGLNTEFLDQLLANTADPSLVYRMFDSMDFSLAREEAQIAFDGCLGNAFMQVVGASVRLDQKVGIRGVFSIDKEVLAGFEAEGYSFELGAVLNLGGDAPTLTDCHTRVVFHESSFGSDEAFFIGEGLAAMAVHFENHNAQVSVLGLNMSGYVVMTDPEGNSQEMLLPVLLEGGTLQLFTAYSKVSAQEEYQENAFLKKVIDRCYDKKVILLDAAEGEDENDGLSSPVQSVGRAYALLLELLSQETVLPTDVTLRFAAGEYYVPSLLSLNGEELCKHYRIHYLGSDQGESVIKGTQRIQDYEHFYDMEEGEDGLFRFYFSSMDDSTYPVFRFLFADGEIQQVATHGYDRTYDAELENGEMWEVVETFPGVDYKGENPTYKMYMEPDAFSDVEEGDFDKLEMHIAQHWYYRVIHVRDVDWSDRNHLGRVAVLFAPEELENWTAQHPIKGNYFWLQNARSFVDEPGEYYYDNGEGILYYMPKDGETLEDTTFEIATTEHLFSFLNLKNSDFKNLVFTGTDNTACEGKPYMGSQATTAESPYYGQNCMAAVLLVNAEGVTFEGCTFRELGSTALQAVGVVRNYTVDSCQFLHIGSSAIYLGYRNGGWNAKSNVTENVLITGNYLDDIAFFTRGSVGIIIGVAKELELSYNTVKNTSYSAVSIGWRWTPSNSAFGTDWHLYHVDVHHNYFESFMTDQSDGGAIYTLGGNVTKDHHEYFNELHDNFVYFDELTWNGKGIVMPYYHDGASSNWRTYNNAEIVTPGRSLFAAIYLQNIEGQITHNLFVAENEIVAATKSPEDYRKGKVYTAYEQEYAIFGPDSTRTPPAGEPAYTRVNADRFLYQENNHLYDHPKDISDRAYSIMCDAGSWLAPPDVDEILDYMAELYDEYYAN